jgi:hypothetical protein
MGSGVLFRPGLVSTVVYGLGNDIKGSASVGMEEKTPDIQTLIPQNPYTVEIGDHNCAGTSPSSVLIPPRFPTISRKPITRLSN